MSTEERSLPGQRVRVTMEDGTGFEVRITNREFLAWDLTRSKRSWPPFNEAIFLALTFTSWKAATREKLTTLGWDQWSDAVVGIEDVTDDEVDVTRPTNPAPAAG
jgi:hypothetical protein